MSEEFEENLVKSNPAVLEVKRIIEQFEYPVSVYGRACFSKEFNNFLSRQSDPLSSFMRFAPDVAFIIPTIGTFLVEVKTRDSKNSRTGRFTLNRQECIQYENIQKILNTKIILVFVDVCMNYYGAQYLDKLNRNNLMEPYSDKAYYFIHEKDLVGLHRFMVNLVVSNTPK